MKYSDRITTYRCYDKPGRQLFLFNFYDRQGDAVWTYSTTLGINLDMIPGALKILEAICSKETSDEARDVLIDNLFEKIQSHPGIESHYFLNEVVELGPSYIKSINSVEFDILSQSTFKDYTPFSCEHNSIHFHALKLQYEELKKEDKIIGVEADHFLELLPFNFTLQSLYVEHHCTNEDFYYYNIHDEEGWWDLYCMEANGLLVWCFLRKTP